MCRQTSLACLRRFVCVEVEAEGARIVDASPDMHKTIRRRPGTGGRISQGDVILTSLTASPGGRESVVTWVPAPV